jgi:predicted alpha/beta hydrolase
MRNGLDRIASTQQIDGVAIEVRILVDENAKRERIIVLKGRGIGEAFVDKIAQGAEVAGGQGWTFSCFGLSGERAAILSDPGHGTKCSALTKIVVGKGSDFSFWRTE